MENLDSIDPTPPTATDLAFTGLLKNYFIREHFGAPPLQDAQKVRPARPQRV